MTQLLVALIACYQRFLSPLLGPCCRFEPSCSRYAHSCLEHHGAARGSWLALCRLLRCNPFFRGGFDPPPLPAHVQGSHAEPDWTRINELYGLGQIETQCRSHAEQPTRALSSREQPS